MKYNYPWIISALFYLSLPLMQSQATDFTRTRVITLENRSRQFDKAVQMLTEEVHRRTRLHWQVNGNAESFKSEIVILTNFVKRQARD